MSYFKLPEVQVIVTNFNYGAFVEEALSSVKGQSYPSIEITLVDDCSTDDSWRIIEDLTRSGARFDDVKVLQTPTNAGHGSAALLGFRSGTAPFVIILDADDVLMPSCVEAHIYAHLSARCPAGVSSVGSLTIQSDQLITTTFSAESGLFLANHDRREDPLIRPVEKVLPDSWFGSRKPAVESRDIKVVLPPTCDPWIWAPMSGNCFRRDAVDIFLDSDLTPKLRAGLDAFLLRPIAASCGSLIIDMPLLCYRVHARNGFIKGAPLSGLRNFDLSSQVENMVAVMKMAVVNMFMRTDLFAARFEEPEAFYKAVEAQCRCWPGLLSSDGTGSFLLECLRNYSPQLNAAFGKPRVAEWMRRAEKSLY